MFWFWLSFLVGESWIRCGRAIVSSLYYSKLMFLRLEIIVTTRIGYMDLVSHSLQNPAGRLLFLQWATYCICPFFDAHIFSGRGLSEGGSYV